MCVVCLWGGDKKGCLEGLSWEQLVKPRLQALLCLTQHEESPPALTSASFHGYMLI